MAEKNLFAEMLKASGYCTFAIPASDLSPLLILHLDNSKKLRVYDRVENVLAPGSPEPPGLEPIGKMPDIEGKWTKKISISGVAGSVSSILGSFQVPGGKLKAAFGDDSQLEFRFVNVRKHQVSQDKIASFFRQQAQINSHGLLAQMFKNGRTYIVTQTLSASGISIAAKVNKKFEASVTLDKIKEIFDGELTVTASSDKEFSFVFNGPEQLAFAFQAMRVHVNVKNGEVTFDMKLEHAAAGQIVFGVPGVQPESEYLLPDDEAYEFQPLGQVLV